MDTHVAGIADENGGPLPEGMTCIWCDGALVGYSLPDDRTMALWLRGSCRDCGDRFSLNASVGEFPYAYDGRRSER